LPYLYKTFAVLLQSIIRDVEDMEEEAGRNLDEVQVLGNGEPIDSENASSEESINALKLQLLCQKFFVQILHSDKQCPGELKHICAVLNDQLSQRYPDFVFKGIGAFLFLRFYNTAITVPESYGLMPESPRPAIRKHLLLVSKVLQNLANNVMFGEKEQNMIRLNSFLSTQRASYEQFIHRLCDGNAELSEYIPIPDDSYRAAIAVIFNQYLLVCQNKPDYPSTVEFMPSDLADLIYGAFKKNKKKKAEATETSGLLDSDEAEPEVVVAEGQGGDVSSPSVPPPVVVGNDDDYAIIPPTPTTPTTPSTTTTTTTLAPPPADDDDYQITPAPAKTKDSPPPPSDGEDEYEITPAKRKPKTKKGKGKRKASVDPVPPPPVDDDDYQITPAPAKITTTTADDEYGG